MKTGVIVGLDDALDKTLSQMQADSIPTCQLCCWDPAWFTPSVASQVNLLTRRYSITISAFWCGWPGPKIWDLISGPVTLGLVPSAYRHIRLQTLLQGSDFARMLDITDLVSHVGFIPESPSDPEYSGLVAAMRVLADHCHENGQHFLFETGQETPGALLRLIHDIGRHNLGVNFDPANLLMYGKANPLDALDLIGYLVRGVHIKDGDYSRNGRDLGPERPVGMGRVNFPRLLRQLDALHYDGALTIEREITGESQRQDILHACSLISGWLDDLAQDKAK